MRRLTLLVLLLALATLLAPAGALAANDQTTATVSCSPSAPQPGTEVSCMVSVLDDASANASSPAGTVTTSAVQSDGGGPVTGSCELTPAGDGMTSTCAFDVTPGAGGQDTVSVDYGGDADHQASSAQTAFTVVDTTATALSCAPTAVAVGQSVACTATVTSAHAGPDLTGSVSFATNPTTDGTLSGAGACDTSAAGTDPSGPSTGSCAVTFTPSAAGTWTITAAYSGDDNHQASSSPGASVTATANGPGGGQIGSGPSGAAGGTGVTAPGPDDQLAATLTITPAVPVSASGMAAVTLSCAGTTGQQCSGTLSLSTYRAPKSGTKPTGSAKGKGKRSGKGRKSRRDARLTLAFGAPTAPAAQPDKRKPPSHRKPPTMQPPLGTTLLLGQAEYLLAAGQSAVIQVHLSKRGLKLLRADRGSLTGSAIAQLEPVTVAGTVHLKLEPAKTKRPPKPKKTRKTRQPKDTQQPTQQKRRTGQALNRGR